MAHPRMVEGGPTETTDMLAIGMQNLVSHRQSSGIGTTAQAIMHNAASLANTELRQEGATFRTPQEAEIALIERALQVMSRPDFIRGSGDSETAEARAGFQGIRTRLVMSSTPRRTE